MKVNILGATYAIYYRDETQDELLKTADGYCDKTTKEIVVIKRPPSCNLGDWEAYSKKVLRHEIIHAFLIESGLCENFEHHTWGHDETMIDWIAYQFPKILDVYSKVGCL